IITAVEFADMLETEPAPLAGAVEIGAALGRCAKLPGRVAAGMVAIPAGFDPPVKPRPPFARTRQNPLRSLCQPSYIAGMTDQFTGPIAAEIHQRLTAALSPTRLVVRDDSERHRGHGGHNAESGESHFTVEIEAEAFA